MAAHNKIKLTDGTEFVVAPTVADTLAWETYAQGSGQDVMQPLHMTVFQVFSAAKRGGHIEQGMPFEVFIDQLESLPEQVEPDRPTKRGRGRASSSK